MQNTSSDDAEFLVMKLSGILLSVLSIVLAGVVYISSSQNIATKHGEIMMITIATYTFYKITMAVIRAVKLRKNPAPLLRTIQNISCAEVAASVLTLQRSMLVSFDPMEQEQVRTMNAMTGAAVCLFVVVLGICMIIKSKKRNA